MFFVESLGLELSAKKGVELTQRRFIGLDSGVFATEALFFQKTLHAIGKPCVILFHRRFRVRP